MAKTILMKTKIKAWAVMDFDGSLTMTYNSESNFQIFGKKWEANFKRIKGIEKVVPCEIIIQEKIK